MRRRAESLSSSQRERGELFVWGPSLIEEIIRFVPLSSDTSHRILVLLEPLIRTASVVLVVDVSELRQMGSTSLKRLSCKTLLFS